jgi:hypothetical protein
MNLNVLLCHSVMVLKGSYKKTHQSGQDCLIALLQNFAARRGSSIPLTHSTVNYYMPFPLFVCCFVGGCALLGYMHRQCN